MAVALGWPLLLGAALAASSSIGPAADGEEGAPSPVVEATVTDLRPELIVDAYLYEGAFAVPAGVHCDPLTGEMYVVDTARGLVGIYDENGSPLFTFGDPKRLDQPTTAIPDRRGRIYVLDGDLSAIKVFSYRGEFLSHLALPGLTGREDAAITALAFDAEGNLYVGDSGRGQVLVYDAALRQLKARIGRKGSGQGELSAITAIAVDAEHVYVADRDGLAVQVFTRYGRFLRGWGRHDVGTENVSVPHGLAVDAKGRVVLIDTMRQEIKYFDPKGRMIDRFGGYGARPGDVAFPTDVSIDRRGRVCLADSGNRRVQVLSVVESSGPAEPDRRPGSSPRLQW